MACICIAVEPLVQRHRCSRPWIRANGSNHVRGQPTSLVQDELTNRKPGRFAATAANGQPLVIGRGDEQLRSWIKCDSLTVFKFETREFGPLPSVGKHVRLAATE